MDSLGTGFDTLLIRGALGALIAAAAWVLVVMAAVALEARTQGRLRFAERAGCPPALRLWLLGLFVAVFAGVSPADASDQGSGTSARGADATVGAALDGLPLPDRPSGSPRRGPEHAVVRPGDSLWRIARDLLPDRAADAEVAALVTDLYARNRHAIGSDPDLVRPGQQLTIPEES